MLGYVGLIPEPTQYIQSNIPLLINNQNDNLQIKVHSFPSGNQHLLMSSLQWNIHLKIFWPTKFFHTFCTYNAIKLPSNTSCRFPVNMLHSFSVCSCVNIHQCHHTCTIIFTYHEIQHHYLLCPTALTNSFTYQWSTCHLDFFYSQHNSPMPNGTNNLLLPQRHELLHPCYKSRHRFMDHKGCYNTL